MQTTKINAIRALILNLSKSNIGSANISTYENAVESLPDMMAKSANPTRIANAVNIKNMNNLKKTFLFRFTLEK